VVAASGNGFALDGVQRGDRFGVEAHISGRHVGLEVLDACRAPDEQDVLRVLQE